jgi:molecular chaperone GrpE
MSETSKEENNKEHENFDPINEESVNASENKQKEEEVKELTSEEKLKISEDKLLRSLAEAENQRRRFEKEIKDAFEFGSFNFAKESLAILDNLQRAKEAIKNDEKLKVNKDLDRFLENITIIEKDLITIFEKNRIKKINTENKKFDPNIHQAMSEIEDEKVEAGTVLQEIQAGYTLGERLLRPALVSVSKKKTPKDDVNIDKKEDK